MKSAFKPKTQFLILIIVKNGGEMKIDVTEAKAKAAKAVKLGDA